MNNSIIMSKDKWIELREKIQFKAAATSMASTVDEIIDLVNNLSPETDLPGATYQDLKSDAIIIENRPIGGDIYYFYPIAQDGVAKTNDTLEVEMDDPLKISNIDFTQGPAENEYLYYKMNDSGQYQPLFLTSIAIEQDENLIPEHIKTGVSIYGIEGTLGVEGGIDTSDATAQAEDIAPGKVAYVKGDRITGAMPVAEIKDPVINIGRRGEITVTSEYKPGYVANAGFAQTSQQLTTIQNTTYIPTTTPQTIPRASYVSDNVTVAGDQNLLAQNIVSGITIFGVEGTFASDSSFIAPILDGSVQGYLTKEVLGSPTRIRSYSFINRLGLTGIDIPNTVRRIGDYCFYGCTNLSKVMIDKTNSQLGPINDNYVHDEKQPVPGLGKSAFQLSGITSISLPTGENHITEIPEYCFQDCKWLKEIDIDSSKITSLGRACFAYAGANDLTSSISLQTFIKNLKADTIPQDAFHGCWLTSLEIPATINTIDKCAFAENRSLTTVTFKGTPTSINSQAFENCMSLTTINVPWAPGEVSGAPWGSNTNNIHYNYNSNT